MKLEHEIKQARFKSPYHKLAVNLLYTGSWFGTQHGRLLKPYGLTPPQYNLLRILRGRHPNPITVNVIRERMLDKMSNVSRLVEKLRLKGLVERHVCETDRRAVDVLITDQGLALLHDLDATEQEWLSLLNTLDVDEAQRLNDLLDKLRG